MVQYIVYNLKKLTCTQFFEQNTIENLIKPESRETGDLHNATSVKVAKIGVVLSLAFPPHAIHIPFLSTP